MNSLLRAVVLAARAWTRLYTAGARAPLRDERRQQIASDLWDHLADARADGGSEHAVAAEIAGCVVRGIPADLAWRLRRGGVAMPPTPVIERGSGVVMVLMVLLLFGTMSRPGISGDEPYFSDDFPTFAANLQDVWRALLFQFAVAVAALLTAALLYGTFRPYSRLGASIGGLALVLAAALFVVSAVAGMQLHGLAGDWRDAGAVHGDALWFEARDAAAVTETFGFFAMAAIALSFASFGIVIARSRALPRGVGIPALAGGVVVVVSVPLLVTGIEVVWLVLMAGMLSVAVSFLLTAGWLALRGTRGPQPRSQKVG